MNFSQRSMPPALRSCAPAAAALVVRRARGLLRHADKPKPAELPPNPALLGVRQAWTSASPKVELPARRPT